MNYYFTRIRKSDLEIYSDATRLKHLKRRCYSHLRSIRTEIHSNLSLDIQPYWISKSTFGAVLCDFAPRETGPSIIGSHKALFELLNEDVDYLVLSDVITRNFKYYNVAGKKILIININRFKKFINAFTNKHKRIQLFLVKHLSSEEEDIINDWIDSKQKEQKITPHISAEDIIETLPKDNPEKASSIVARVNDYYESQVISNLKYYEGALNEFEVKVKNPKIQESELRDDLKEKIWIIDFRYQNINQFNCEKEVPIENGKIDLWVSRSKTQRFKDIIIELKLPKDSLKKYRKKPAIRSEIGNALSQLINYLENEKSRFKIQNGLVIIGREPEESFIEVFNQYLHGIQIKTYRQLIDDCRNVINGFKVPVLQSGVLDK